MPNDPHRHWIPGVLSDKQVTALVAIGAISNVVDKNIAYSSVDLTLADEGYLMVQGSVKPFGGGYEHFIQHKPEYSQRLTQEEVYELSPTKTYVFKVKEKLNAAILRNWPFYGQATAKSSVGRVDVLIRLIVDGMTSYEGFTPTGLQYANGDMYIEITPITFKVRVKVGSPLSQLRLFYGEPEQSEIRGKELYSTVLHRPDGKDAEGFLSVNLHPTPIRNCNASAFEGHWDVADKPINLWDDAPESLADPCQFWRLKQADSATKLVIKEKAFYILRSNELISLPKGVAVYCRAIDETIGEMRIHYAGFVHPFFGFEREDGTTGTPLIFEVRGHDVNVLLDHGERLARLTFYRMSEDVERRKDEDKSYNDQTLKLSKYFRSWPECLECDEHGRVWAA